ncbi:MAG: sensor histidine kinase [Acetatifactor sp.]
MEEREFTDCEEMGEQPKQQESETVPPVRIQKKRKFTLRGCFLAKLLAFLMFMLGAAAAIAGGVCCIIAIDSGMYRNDYEFSAMELLRGEAYRFGEQILPWVIYDEKEPLESLLSNNALEAELGYIPDPDGGEVEWVWSSYSHPKELEGHKYADAYIYLPDKGTLENASSKKFEGWRGEYAIVRVYFDLTFPVHNQAWQIYESARLLYLYRYECIGVTLLGAGLALIMFFFLLGSVGHRNGKEGIQPSAFRVISFDLLTVLAAGAVLSVGLVGSELIYCAFGAEESLLEIVLICAYILFCAVIGMLYLMEFANRVKEGRWWRHTIVYSVLTFCFRLLKRLAGVVLQSARRVSMIRVTLLVTLGITFCEFVGIVGFDRDAVAVSWLIEKFFLLPFIFYLAYCCKKLFYAGKQLAEGKENYRVDTARMIGSLKEHGENLNNISEGIGKAVDARMRSERLKTELITNVSHDIKTPLTSIINYATLISEMETGNEQLDEYSEVLVRQSNRLKKLLEDLVEASKASTGNLEVQMSRCDVGVLLTQAVGEYETRMTEKGLEIRSTIPEEPVFIQADGRHLWRVFDNLMNNILKYAQENSRVYLSLDRKEGRVEVIFRNMSKYPLDISAEELEERFARGDKSRHLEGNGLGLSIAKSLTELQKGTFEIIVDGDLFKVVLTFPADAE